MTPSERQCGLRNDWAIRPLQGKPGGFARCTEVNMLELPVDGRKEARFIPE